MDGMLPFGASGVDALAAAAAVTEGRSHEEAWRMSRLESTNRAMSLDEIAQRLSLDQETIRRAHELNEVAQNSAHSSSESSPLRDTLLNIAIVWMAGRLNVLSKARSVQANGVTVNQLLNLLPAAQLTVDVFCDHMKTFVETDMEALPRETYDALINQIDFLRRAYMALLNVYKRYTMVFSTLYKGEVWLIDVMATKAQPRLIVDVIDALIAEDNINSANAFLLLLCAVALIACQDEDNLEFRPEVKQLIATLDEPNPAITYTAIMRYLIGSQDVPSSDLSSAENSFSQLMKEITQRRLSGFSHEYRGVRSSSADVTWSLPNIQGLLRERTNALQSNIMSIDRVYEENLHMSSGNFDGRSLLTSARGGGFESPRKHTQTPRFVNLRSPAARNLGPQFDMVFNPMTATPMTANMEDYIGPGRSNSSSSMSRLNLEALRSLPEQPTPRLVSFFDACSPSPETAIAARQNDVSAWLSTTVPNKAHVWSLVARTYYHILEAMLRREQARLKTENFGHLLNDSNYHKSLLACTIEVVRHEHKVEEIGFEQLLYYMHLRPFYFLLVIEPFVLEMHQLLGRNCIRRLKEIEERILESEAWKDRDPLYVLLHEEETEMGTTGTETTIQSSPRKAIQAVAQVRSFTRMINNSDVTTGSAVHKRSFKCTSLQFFYRKLYRLAHVRLSQLCAHLGANEILQRTWDVLVEVLAREGQLQLLYKRHLDTTIMCTVYCVSKIKLPEERQLKFRDIINKYILQPQCDSASYRKIDLADHNVGKPVDIIQFYNLCFLSNIMPIVNMLSSDGGAGNAQTIVPATEATSAASGEPIPILPAAPLPQNSPLRLPSRSRVFVASLSHMSDPSMTPNSNLRHLTHQLHVNMHSMTPRTKKLFSVNETIGQSPQKQIQDINNMVAASSMLAPTASSAWSVSKRLFQSAPPDETALPESAGSSLGLMPMSPPPKRPRKDTPSSDGSASDER